MTTILYLYYFIINLTGAVLSRTKLIFSIFSWSYKLDDITSKLWVPQSGF